MRAFSRLAAAASLALFAACGGGGHGGSAGPAAASASVAMLEGTTLLKDVIAIHPEVVLPATVSIVAAPRHGIASVDPDQRVRYDPDTGWNGADTLDYHLVPSSGSPLTDTLTITVYQSIAAGAPAVLLPETSITAREVAVIVNDDDPQSVAVAAYYVPRRGIPASHVVHLHFTPGGDTMTSATFAPLKAAVDAAVGPDVQALVLTWTNPYRVDLMSITSAFALGFDVVYENLGPPCAQTQGTPYYASASTQPFTDHGVRPTMMLAGVSSAEVFALIDRGVASDDTFPTGTGYFVRTTDPARSVRWPSMVQTLSDWDPAPDGLALSYTDNSAGGASDSLTGKTDVLLYLTGLASVPSIGTNTYAPGAVADHLTSYGGILTAPSGQMSVLRWLEAGATASFGTVVEPCNYTEKFPDPSILLDHYYRGETLIEAYWKSVSWPGEGIFVGEPLARPFGRAFVSFDAAHTLKIKTTSLEPGRLYDLLAADSPAGPFTVALGGISIPHHRLATVTLPAATRVAYKLVPAP
jgi:uncharacterized protein (TIGR03790 family)